MRRPGGRERLTISLHAVSGWWKNASASGWVRESMKDGTTLLSQISVGVRSENARIVPEGVKQRTEVGEVRHLRHPELDGRLARW